eukprot:1619227-Ditylum_brightwellii.AAC.1
MNQIFTHFREAGLKENLSNSTLFQKALEFIKFWLEPNGYHPLTLQIQGIQDMQQPTSCKEVPILSDTDNIIQKHIQYKAAVMEPIAWLTSNKVPFVWGRSRSRNFNRSSNNAQKPSC